MEDLQIKHMVDRFLGWKLPENFNPDGGVSFKRMQYNEHLHPMPTGTNLFDYEQTEEMVRYMIDGLPNGTLSAGGEVMKLTELEPRWITFGSAATAEEFKGKRWYIGLSFLCPHCQVQRVAVFFENDIDDGVRWAYETWDGLNDIPAHNLLWRREGDTFETMTLIPSIDLTLHGHWHGSIVNGVIQ